MNSTMESTLINGEPVREGAACVIGEKDFFQG